MGIPKAVLEEIGRYLMRTFLPVLVPMVQAIESQRRAKEEARGALVKAVEAQPFQG